MIGAARAPLPPVWRSPEAHARLQRFGVAERRAAADRASEMARALRDYARAALHRPAPWPRHAGIRDDDFTLLAYFSCLAFGPDFAVASGLGVHQSTLTAARVRAARLLMTSPPFAARAQAFVDGHITGRGPRVAKTGIADVIAWAEAHFGFSRRTILSKQRARRIVVARHAVWWLARETTGLSLADIAAATGAGDHTSIRSGCLILEARFPREPSLGQTLRAAREAFLAVNARAGL